VRPDIYDSMAAVGLILLAVGLAMINLAVALAVVGALLLWLGVFLASRRGGG